MSEDDVIYQLENLFVSKPVQCQRTYSNTRSNSNRKLSGGLLQTTSMNILCVKRKFDSAASRDEEADGQEYCADADL